MALREFLAAQQNVKTAEADLRAAREDERVAKVRYEAGRSVLVEYLDAVAALVRAEVNYAQALYERAVALDKMVRVVGGDKGTEALLRHALSQQISRKAKSQRPHLSSLGVELLALVRNNSLHHPPLRLAEFLFGKLKPLLVTAGRTQ